MQIKNEIANLKKEMDEISATVKNIPNGPDKVQKTVNLSSSLNRKRTEYIALLWLLNRQKLTIRSHPQYDFTCSFCNRQGNFRVKELRDTLKHAHRGQCEMQRQGKALGAMANSNFDVLLKKLHLMQDQILNGEKEQRRLFEPLSQMPEDTSGKQEETTVTVPRGEGEVPAENGTPAP